MHNRKLLNSELGRPSITEYKELPKLPIVVVLDNIRSQFNIGATFRSSDAFSVQSVLLCGICACPPSAEIHKSALGAELSVPWEYYNSTLDAISNLKADGYTVISVEQAERSISLEHLGEKLNASQRKEMEKIALVFGNEVFGVSQEVVDMSDYVVEIPQAGTKHSINVSVSVGVVLWEIFRLKRLNS